jgi:hypothetical protein
MLNQKNSRKQGDVGLGVAIGYFVTQGYTVSLPLTDNQDYDLIVDIDERLNRVQVKTSRMKSRNSKGYEVQLRTCGGNRSGSGVVKKFDPDKVEFVFVLTDDGTRYFIPSSCVKGSSSISVGNLAYQEFVV